MALVWRGWGSRSWAVAATVMGGRRVRRAGWASTLLLPLTIGCPHAELEFVPRFHKLALKRSRLHAVVIPARARAAQLQSCMSSRTVAKVCEKL